MSQNGSSSPTSVLFTIEQTELIRRLRKSGVTKEQLIVAYESFDKLDRELGPDDSQSPNQNGQHSNPISPASSNGPLNYSTNNLSQQNGSSLLTQQNGLLTQNVNGSSLFATNGGLSLPSCSFIQQRKMMELGLMPSGYKRPYSALEDNGLDNSYDSLIGESMMNDVRNPGPPGRPHKMLLEAEAEEGFLEELNEFALKGENVIYEEIREFVHKHGVKQHQLAAICGLSQSYVSRYLRGDYHDIADKSKRAIHRWYLVAKKNPAVLVMTLNMTFIRRPSLNTMTPIVSQIPFGLDHDIFGSQRRERFVFKQAHIEILEKHFKADNYPSFQKREEIARECNSAAEANRTDGRPLSEREVVNVQVVTNWYANKRKELKKIAKEEGLDNIIAQMRSRGRPCASRVDSNPNPFSGIENLTSTHPNHSSSANIQSQLIQQMQQQIQNQMNEINGQGQGQMDANDANEQSYTMTDEEESEQLSLAVEVAAVNSAILEFTGNNLASIKQEFAAQNAATP